jgi:hypothetical protein
MTQPRTYQFILIASLIVFSWLAMMLVHELGHVIGALLTGAEVLRVVWHPLVFSRTDIGLNPAPLIVVWAGPLIGIQLPTTVAFIMQCFKCPVTYMADFFAGFCLLANGLYIGLGSFDQIGDAGDMLRLGSPQWVLLAFGLSCVITGLFQWHRISPTLGLGTSQLAKAIRPRHAYGMVIVAVLLCSIGFLLGDRGL